jgi:4a-hydroxytetrahydrobiopterin dehydratase
MTDLRLRRCLPLDGGAPMKEGDVASHLARVRGWQARDGAIEKVHRFVNFHETMAFMNAVAWICHTEDHHPDVALSYNRCALRFNTHSVGGISINDFICAAKVDALLPDDA